MSFDGTVDGVVINVASGGDSMDALKHREGPIVQGTEAGFSNHTFV
jgi:hypothetical protein